MVDYYEILNHKALLSALRQIMQSRSSYLRYCLLSYADAQLFVRQNK